MNEIKPALTPEEWAEAADQRALQAVLESASAEVDAWNPPSRHGLAALTLHGQPFGFTWEDVDRVRSVAEPDSDWYREDEWLVSLADRIAALLPPREP